MAIRLDAQGDTLSRTANLPSTTSFTICGWTRKRGAGGTDGIVAGLADATLANYCALDHTSSLFLIYTGGAQDSGINPGTDEWYFYAISCAATGVGNLKGYVGRATDAALTAWTGTGVSFTPTQAIWSLNNAAYWYNSAHAAIKVWDAQLTQAEIEREWRSMTPVRTANLNIWIPGNRAVLADADNDYSGNGRDLTTAGTLTIEDGPPVPWGASPIIVGKSVSGVADTFDVTISDNASSSDSQSIAWTAIGTISETSSSTDTQSVAWISPVSFSESSSASDVKSVVLVSPVSLSENASSSDTESAIFTAIGTISETSSSSDIQSTTWTAIGSITESSNATDTKSSTWTTVGTISESASAADVQSVEHLQGVTAVTLSETASSSDSNSATWTAVGSISESSSSSDSISIAWDVVAAINESASSIDVQSVDHIVAGTVDVSLSESASSSDSLSVSVVWATSLLEDAIPVDSIAAASVFNTLQNESSSASDSMSGVVTGAISLTPEDLTAIATAVWAHPKALTLGKFLALK